VVVHVVIEFDESRARVVAFLWKKIEKVKERIMQAHPPR